MANRITGEYGDPSTAPADDVVPVTPGASALPDGPCRALLVGVAGTVNLTTLAGVQRDGVPLVEGWNPVGATHVRTGGTATGIWAVY